MSQFPTQSPGSAETLAESPDRSSILIEAIERSNATACETWLASTDTSDAVHALARLSDDDRVALFSLLTPETGADVLAILPDSQAIEALESLQPPVAARIIEGLSSDERADVIKAMSEEEAEAVLTELDDAIAADVRRLIGYHEDSAGSLMLTEYLAFPETATIREVLADIELNAERYADYNIQYTYVIDSHGRLRGVLPLRNILLAPRSGSVIDIMIPDPIRVADNTTLDGLRAAFREHNYMGLPVVNAAGRLLGVVEQSDLTRADADEADSLYRQSQGIVGGEELRSMPLHLRSRRRLAWLSANIVLNIIAASMIAMQQDTLEAVIALAVFLPIISDMSGCSGNQAVAVTMRELTLGVTRPRDIFRVLIKESTLGLINGIVLGMLIGVVAYMWKHNVYLSAVVGVSLAMNTIIAVCIGGVVPLILKRMKADPALASGPILTTITDMCGFFIVLTLASLLLTRLT